MWNSSQVNKMWRCSFSQLSLSLTMTLQFYVRRNENDTSAALNFVHHMINLYEYEHMATNEEMVDLDTEIKNIYGCYLHQVKTHRLDYLHEKQSMIEKKLQFLFMEGINLVYRLNNLYNHGGRWGYAGIVGDHQSNTEGSIRPTPRGSIRLMPRESIKEMLRKYAERLCLKHQTQSYNSF